MRVGPASVSLTFHGLVMPLPPFKPLAAVRPADAQRLVGRHPMIDQLACVGANESLGGLGGFVALHRLALVVLVGMLPAVAVGDFMPVDLGGRRSIGGNHDHAGRRGIGKGWRGEQRYEARAMQQTCCGSHAPSLRCLD